MFIAELQYVAAKIPVKPFLYATYLLACIGLPKNRSSSYQLQMSLNHNAGQRKSFGRRFFTLLLYIKMPIKRFNNQLWNIALSGGTAAVGVMPNITSVSVMFDLLKADVLMRLLDTSVFTLYISSVWCTTSRFLAAALSEILTERRKCLTLTECWHSLYYKL